MVIFNLEGPFPGKLIDIAQAFMNFYKKKEMLTLVTFASLGGLSKIQKMFKSFPVKRKKIETHSQLLGQALGILLNGREECTISG